MSSTLLVISNNMSNLDYQKLSQTLFNGLSERQKSIIFKRFGLTSGKGETLEAIGNGLGLTRERVRQIIAAALKKIRKENLASEITKVFLHLKQYFQENGGLKREDLLFLEPEFNHQQNSRNWINLLLVLNEDFYRVNESKDFYPFWVINPNTLISTEKVLKLLEKKLLKQKKTLEFKELLAVSDLTKKSDQQFLKSSLESSKKILKAIDGKYGLKSWPEVNPRGVRDLALLVFRKIKKPLHFVEVASLIDEIAFGQKDSQEFSVIAASAAAGVPRKKTNFQTVHNQLIKDSQFVLIGRGVYALKEWGYDPGTVRDMISKVLKEAKNPLPEKEIMKRVLSQRLVKESTILLNLGNKKCFLKQEDGRYSLREA